MPITDCAGMKTRSEVSSLIPCSLLHSQDYTSDLGKNTNKTIFIPCSLLHSQDCTSDLGENTNKKLVFQDCPKTQIFFQAARSIEGCKCLLKSFVLSFVVSLFSCALVTVKMECHKPTVSAFPICSKSDVMLNKWAMTLTSCSKIPFYHALFICRICQALTLAKYFWISVSRCFFLICSKSNLIEGDAEQVGTDTNTITL